MNAFLFAYISSRTLFYDGIRKNSKLQWHTIPAYRKTNFPISHVWYQKSRYVGQHVNQSLTNESDPPDHLSCDDCTISEQETVSSKNAKKILQEMLNTRTRNVPLLKNKKIKAFRIPVGMSLQCVAAKGRVPECLGCRQKIQRGEKRLVNKTVINQDKKWYEAASYHLNASCLESTLSIQEKHEVTCLMKADSSLGSIQFHK
jgi:hypothetical protein